jgi:RNA chaperone Hfq
MKENVTPPQNAHERNRQDEREVMVHRKLIRPTLTEVKEQMARPAPQPGQGGGGGGHQGPRRKPAPPDQTHAENFYYVKQMQSRTPVAVVLNDGEVLRGTVEWYDRDCIKLTRSGNPNLLIYKHAIKYIYKEGEENARGGSNGQ